MYYLYLVIAVHFFAIQVSFSKLYQLKAGSTLRSILYFSFFCALTSVITFWALSGFQLDPIPPYSLLMGGLIGLAYFSLNLIGIKAISLGNMSLYSMFLMLGLMLLPFLYGRFFLEESVSIFQTIALGLLLIALILPAFKPGERKNRMLFYLLCVLVFMVNGFVGILTKMHQIQTSSISVLDFTVVIQMVTAGYSLIALLILGIVQAKKHTNGSVGNQMTIFSLFRQKTIIFILGFALFSSFGYMLQLLSAVHLPATVMYPIVTGGAVVLTTLAGRIFFREKLTTLAIISIVLAFIATILFAF
ncbi:MAG: hypothetical protein PHP61_05740 [Candidatus Izemoplasmatales bacterium]|nr:hypothetical protein [Candidatus Izemoplasmatales bacterium]